MKKKIKKCCQNCHYADLQFKNLVKNTDNSNKYGFNKDWDMSLDDALVCFYPNVDSPFKFKEIEDDFVCDCFMIDKQRALDIKAGC